MKKLYVGNLAFGVSEQDIQGEFANMGLQPDSITIIRDRITGQSKGFGFVELSSDADAGKAIGSLNGKDLMGRAIVVNEARPMTERKDGCGNRRGGFGSGGGGQGNRGGGRRGY